MNRKYFTENVGLKLVSLALAAGLWAAVGSDPITEATFRVPLEFINVPANMEVLTGESSVQLWARGPSQAVRQSVPGDFVVRVNIRPFSLPGEHTYSLDPSGVASPAALQVVELIPSQVRVALEASMTKTIPIQPRFSGEVAQGYRLKDFHLRPEQAVIAGPESHVGSVAAASTDPVDISGLSSNTTFSVSLEVSDPLVRFTRGRTVAVDVEVEKAQEPAEDAPAAAH